jgi:hypothetical protein
MPIPVEQNVIGVPIAMNDSLRMDVSHRKGNDDTNSGKSSFSWQMTRSTMWQSTPDPSERLSSPMQQSIDCETMSDHLSIAIAPPHDLSGRSHRNPKIAKIKPITCY